MQIFYKVGDITKQSFDKLTFIPHVCNEESGGTMGSGVAKALYTKWPRVKSEYHDWAGRYAQDTYVIYQSQKKIKPQEPHFKLGRIKCVVVEDNVVVVNMLAQSDCGGFKGKYHPWLPPIRYDALEECLIRLKDELYNCGTECCVQAPLFGTELAGGDPSTIRGLVEEIFSSMDLDWTWVGFTQEKLDAFQPKDGR